MVETVRPVAAQTNSVILIQIFCFHCTGCSLERWQGVTLEVPWVCPLTLLPRRYHPLHAPRSAQTPPGLHHTVLYHEQEQCAFLCHRHQTLGGKEISFLPGRKCQMTRLRVHWVLFSLSFNTVDLKDEGWGRKWRGGIFLEVLIMNRSLFSIKYAEEKPHLLFKDSKKNNLTWVSLFPVMICKQVIYSALCFAFSY